MVDMKKWPEVCDFVSVEVKGVLYYGYVDDIDFDLRDPRICVEFYPGCRNWFSFGEFELCNYPHPMTQVADA